MQLKFTLFGNLSAVQLVVTLVVRSVVVTRTSTDADVAEQLQGHHDEGSRGVVDPAAEERIGDHERRVEIPDSTPEERLADEQQQTYGVVVDE